MARSSDLDRTSNTELSQLETEIAHLKAQQPLHERMAVVARELGFDLGELREAGHTDRRGSVAPKYRDPNNPQNVWSGRGRMPLWMVAATKGGKGKKEDFLI